MKYHDKTEVERRYWSVGEVARKLEVAPSAIRYWIDEFGMDARIKRNRHQDRMLESADVELLREIHRLLKAELYTVAGVRRKLVSRLAHYHQGSMMIDEVEVNNMLRVG